MTIVWLIVSLLLALCALQMFALKTLVGLILGVALLFITIISLLSAYWQWKGFRPTVFEFEDDGENKKKPGGWYFP